jgi:hypothetical protein
MQLNKQERELKRSSSTVVHTVIGFLRAVFILGLNYARLPGPRPVSSRQRG